MIKCCVTSTWHYRGFVFVVVSYNVILRPNCIAILQWFYWLIGYYSYCLITISYRTLLGNNTKNMLHTPAQRMFNEDLWLVAKNHWWHQHRQQSSSQLAPALMFKLLIRIWHREGISVSFFLSWLIYHTERCDNKWYLCCLLLRM